MVIYGNLMFIYGHLMVMLWSLMGHLIFVNGHFMVFYVQASVVLLKDTFRNV